MKVTYVAGWGTSAPAAFNTARADHPAQPVGNPARPVAAAAMGGQEMVTPPGFGFAIPNRAAELLDGLAERDAVHVSEAYV